MADGKEYVSRPDELGNIHISEEVLAAIAAAAATEVEGVGSLAANLGSDIAELLGGKKNLSKGVKVLVTDRSVDVDLALNIDYGYSIIEKIRQAAFDGDTMLNMPVIAFIGEESYRAKEAKSDTFSEQWGDYKEREAMWEIAVASAMISAGADIVVLWNPKSVEALKSLLKGDKN